MIESARNHCIIMLRLTLKVYRTSWEERCLTSCDVAKDYSSTVLLIHACGEGSIHDIVEFSCPWMSVRRVLKLSISSLLRGEKATYHAAGSNESKSQSNALSNQCWHLPCISSRSTKNSLYLLCRHWLLQCDHPCPWQYQQTSCRNQR